MYLNYRGISRAIAAFFMLIGASMIPSMFVCIIYKEINIALDFAIVVVPLLTIGFLMLRIIKPSPFVFKIRDGFLIVAICWVMVSVFGALPFITSGYITSFIDAFFETSSGFSTTGASIVIDIETFPKGLLFWRSFTHWLGGLGILFMTIALWPALGLDGQSVARAEVTGPTFDKITPKITDSARRLYLIYISFTFLQTMLLMFGGIGIYDSLVYTFGSVGTGGFATYANSVEHFNSAYIDAVITVFMLLSGVSFNLYYVGLTRGVKSFFKDSELRLYITIVSVSIGILALYLFAVNTYGSVFQSLRYASFQVASIITTTGYATTNYDLWPTFAKMILFMLMLVGGCSGSTAGGIKVIRILVLLKLIKRGILVRLHPNAVVQVKLRGKNITTDTVQAIANFVLLYIGLIFVSTVFVSIDGYDLTTNITAVMSCIGNIGPGFNLVGPAMNFSIFSKPVTLWLSFLMLAGRLELYTIIMLFSPRFWNPNR